MVAMRNILVILVVASSVGSGCASAPAFKEMGDSSAQSGLIFRYRIKGATEGLPDEGCKLSFKHLRTGREFVLSVLPSRSFSVVEADAGVYEPEMLRCPNFKSWVLKDSLRKIDVQAGKVSDSGVTVFEFSKGQLSTVSYADRPEQAKATGELFKTLPVSISSRIVLSYTGKPITAAMTTHPGEFRLMFHFKSFGHEKLVREPLVSAASACETSEHKRFPVQIGNLSWFATYEQGKLVRLVKNANDHAFSDEFEKCLERAFKEHSPEHEKKVEVTFSY